MPSLFFPNPAIFRSRNRDLYTRIDTIMLTMNRITLKIGPFSLLFLPKSRRLRLFIALLMLLKSPERVYSIT